MQVSCPKRVFLLRCYTYVVVLSFPDTAVFHKYLKQDCPNLLPKLQIGRVTHLEAIPHDNSEVICWRHLAPYREYISTCKLRLVTPSHYWTKNKLLFIVSGSGPEVYVDWNLASIRNLLCSYIFLISDFYGRFDLCSTNISECG